MKYTKLENINDPDIEILNLLHNLPDISRYLSMDEENYWSYVTKNDNVFYYKVFDEDLLVSAVHCELDDQIIYLAILVAPSHQKKGIATKIIKDIIDGKLIEDFQSIEVSIDETNIASIKLFEKCGFEFSSKDGELLTYIYKKESEK